MPNQDFLVRRDDLSTTDMIDAAESSPGDGDAIINIERFAITANNITYGVAGDAIGYWNFFPANQGWGRIPVWGIGRVGVSNHQGLTVGDRYYGYFPMSHVLKVVPEGVSARGFTDGVSHRASLPVVYNQYSRVSADNGFVPAFDNHQMVYRPLFTTSFVLDDYFADNQDFGAAALVLGSASSKTAFGLAFMLRQSRRVRVVGLTSTTNKGFVEGLGLYDEVLSYDDVETLNASEKVAYIDMSGNRPVLSRIHHHFGDNLVNSCGVGITHWESRDGESPASLPGARPKMFFAPNQIVKRNKELGPAAYQARLMAATNAFLERVDDWVTIEEHTFADVDAVYRQVLNGAPPARAFVIRTEGSA